MTQTVDTSYKCAIRNGGYFRRPSNYIGARVLAANAPETFTIPTGCSYIVPRSNADVYYRIGGTATVPAADVTDGEGSEFLTDDLYVAGIASISVISASACTVTFSCYKE